jgi:hypothetical protein
MNAGLLFGLGRRESNGTNGTGVVEAESEISGLHTEMSFGVSTFLAQRSCSWEEEEEEEEDVAGLLTTCIALSISSDVFFVRK